MPNKAPGSLGFPLTGSAVMFRSDPIRFIQKHVSKHGDVSRVRLGPYHYHIINSPELVKQVLRDRHIFTKETRSIDLTKLICGENLITSESDIWHRKRKLIQPAFHRKQIHNLVSHIVKCGHETVERWTTKKSVNLTTESLDITFDIVTNCLFSGDVGDEKKSLQNAIDEVLETTSKRIATIIPPVLPTPRNRRFTRAKSYLYETVGDIVEQRLVDANLMENSSKADLLSLLTLKDPDGQFDKNEIIEESLTFLMAGHETSANALCWILFFLSRHPEIQDEVSQEVNSLSEEAYTLENLAYTTAVVKEAMRLRPPIWIMERHVTEETEIGGFQIPPNSSVVLPIYTIHRHPEHWDDPDVFNPKRFLSNTDNPAYIPFGVGARSCIGSHLAMLETAILTAMLIKKLKLSVNRDKSVKLEPGLTLRPAESVHIDLCVRQPQD